MKKARAHVAFGLFALGLAWALPTRAEILVKTPRLELKSISRNEVNAALDIMFDPRLRSLFFAHDGDTSWAELRQEQSVTLRTSPKDFDKKYMLDYRLGIFFEGRLVGVISAESKDETWPPYDTIDLEVNRARDLWYALSYVIHPDYWGRAFAGEALVAFQRFLDSHPIYKVTGFYAKTLPENTASQRVLQKCEFHSLGAHDQYKHFARRLRN